MSSRFGVGGCLDCWLAVRLQVVESGEIISYYGVSSVTNLKYPTSMQTNQPANQTWEAEIQRV